MFRHHTPIESYLVRGTEVLVKRDDLYGSWPAPPLGKLRGARVLLRKLFDGGTRLVGCWDTRISALGQGIAACCSELPGMNALLTYPAKKGCEVPRPLQVAESLGAEVLGVRAGRITISFSEGRKVVENRGGTMLPFGLECAEAVYAVSSEAGLVPPSCTHGGTVVLCAGSGVTLAGLLLGLRGQPSRFIAASSGRSPRSIARCLRKYGAFTSSEIHIEPARCPYSEPIRQDCPFPSHPHYDLKAWRLLCEEIDHLAKPILFWNVGS